MENQGRPDEHDEVRENNRFRLAEARAQVRSAALVAERSTGHREETLEGAEHGLVWRAIRAIGGFALVGVGIALLPLPGPGWIVIIVGLSLLPFAWAERTIRVIRRRIPGVPEDGRIPLSTWIVMGLIVAAVTAVSILFGKQFGHWMGNTWEEIWS